MQIPQTKLQKIKTGVYGGQALLIFIAGVLTLVVMTKTGGVGGETGFFFALCFLSIPALIYQVMVPMWTRAWRFANVYAYAFIDVLYALLWFSASIAVAVWNAQGISNGAKDGKNNDSSSSPSSVTSKRDGKTSPSCDTFAYGSASKCSVSKASVGFGILVFFLYGITAAIAIHQVFVYRRTGVMPNGNSKTHGQSKRVAGFEDPNKDAWSANVEETDHDLSHQRSDDRLRFGQDMEEDEQGLLQHQASHQRLDSHDGAGVVHPGTPMGYESSTLPPARGDPAPSYYDSHDAPSALSPTAAHDPHEHRLHFPQGNYDSVGI